VLAFRHGGSPYRTAEVALRGVDPGARYELSYDVAGRKETVAGAALRERLLVTLELPRSSEMIMYRRVEASERR
jgi:hypothetical protein